MNFWKRFTACGLSVLLAISVSSISVNADIGAISAAGLTNSVNGEDLSKADSINRAEFARMLVSLTRSEKKLNTLSKKQLFKDIKKKNKYLAYINLVARLGYMNGYSDKSFNSKKKMTLSMAAYSALRLLGYENSELVALGGDGIMEKFNALQLNKNIGKAGNNILTGDDVAVLIYNLLSAQKKDGTILGKSLGYTFNADGSLDTASLINAGSKLVIASKSGCLEPFMEADHIYRNGKKAGSLDIQRLDLLYYNKGTKTVHAYSDKVNGSLSKVLPSTSNPKSIVIAGQTLELSGNPLSLASSPSYGVNSWKAKMLEDDIDTGSFVTAIKDTSGKVVALFKQSLAEDTTIGYVVKNETKKVSKGNGGFEIVNIMTVITTNNNELEVKNPFVAIGTGQIVKVSYDSTGEPIVRIENNSGGSLNGKVLADDLRAIEVSNDLHAPVSKGLLSSLDLSKINAAYIGYNKKGEVNELILQNAIGEAYRYGLITEFRGDTVSYMIGKNSSMAEYEQGFSLDPARFAVAMGFKDNKLNTVKPLNEVQITKIDGNIAITRNGRYLIADDIDVYYKSFNEWKTDKVKDMNNIDGHIVKGYYLDSSNVIRLIIIEK